MAEQSEATFQQTILDLCAWLKLRVFHSGDSRRDSCAGYPDLTIVGPGGLVFAELKAPRGRVTPEQRDWLDALSPHATTALWRPADMGEIEATLKRIARKP